MRATHSTPPPLEGLGREADQGWGEGPVGVCLWRRRFPVRSPLPLAPSHEGRGKLKLCRRFPGPPLALR